MSRIALSPWYLGWVAFCSALCVAIATGTTRDDSLAVQIAAGLLGLAVALAIAFLSLMLLARPRTGEPAADMVVPAAPEPEPEPEDSVLRGRLETQLVTGRLLQTEPRDERADEWIDATHSLLAAEAPGAARYFAAPEWPAQVARLETILRDFL